MAAQIFDALTDLVRQVKEGSDATAFVGKYRNKDYYCLADSEDSALAEIASKLGVELGYVPLDLIVKATLQLGAGVKSPDLETKPEPLKIAGNGEAKPPAADDLSGATVPEIRKIAEDLGIPHKGVARSNLVDQIKTARASMGQKTLPV